MPKHVHDRKCIKTPYVRGENFKIFSFAIFAVENQTIRLIKFIRVF